MTDLDALLDTCRRLVDPHAALQRVESGHDGTRTLRVATSAGDVIVKAHRHRQRHQQELHAYRHWTPSLDEQAPRLIATNDDPPTVILTALPGTRLAEAHLDPATQRRVHERAGALLARYHQAGSPRTSPSMTEWLATRGEQWLAVAHHLIPEAGRDEIRAHLHAIADLGPIDAVPCHLDYTPRNLLSTLDGTIGTIGTIGVIDFEHSRYDLAARDLVRLATRVWPTNPHLEDAFLAGYGPLSDLDRTIIEHCAYLDALTRLARAHHLRAPMA